MTQQSQMVKKKKEKHEKKKIAMRAQKFVSISYKVDYIFYPFYGDHKYNI